MSHHGEDLLLGNDEDQPPPPWWSPSPLLTPEATSITAFTIAAISITTPGNGSAMLAEHRGTHRRAAPPRARRRPCPDPAQPSQLMEDDDVRFLVRSGTAGHRGGLGAGPRPQTAAPVPRPRGRHTIPGPGGQGVRQRPGRQVDVTRSLTMSRAGSPMPLWRSGGNGTSPAPEGDWLCSSAKLRGKRGGAR